MSLTVKRIGNRQKCCRQCFAYVSYNSRKCKYCRRVFKSPGKYLLDIITGFLKIDGVAFVRKNSRFDAETNLFTRQEIETILDMENLKIPTYFVLSDINSLKETSLDEFNETMILPGKD